SSTPSSPGVDGAPSSTRWPRRRTTTSQRTPVPARLAARRSPAGGAEVALLGAPTRERLPSTPRSVERISFGAASFWVGVAVLVVFLLPARAVLQGMGAAGRPHFLIAAGLLLWWLIAQSHPELRQGLVHPLVALVFAYSGWLVVTWVLGYDRGLSVLESSSTDRALIAAAAYLGIVVVAASSRSMRQVDAVLQVAVAGAAFS